MLFAAEGRYSSDPGDDVQDREREISRLRELQFVAQYPENGKQERTLDKYFNAAVLGGQRALF